MNNVISLSDVREDREKYQIESGEFSKICNQILLDLGQHHFTPAESQIIHIVIRFTYGFRRKTDRFTLDFLAQQTGLKKNRISETLKGLFKKNVLFRTDGQRGEIGYQKYADQWRFSEFPENRTVRKTGNSVSGKPESQKITPYKDEKKTLKASTDVDARQNKILTTVSSHQDRKSKRTPYAEIVALYHEVLPTLPSVKKLTDRRKAFVKARHQDGLPSIDHWREYFEYVSESRFLMGKIERKEQKPFIADFEWLIRESNFIKVWEGKYHD